MPTISVLVNVLGAMATKTKLRNLYFSERDSQVNKQSQNCQRNMQVFKDNTRGLQIRKEQVRISFWAKVTARDTQSCEPEKQGSSPKLKNSVVIMLKHQLSLEELIFKGVPTDIWVLDMRAKSHSICFQFLVILNKAITKGCILFFV